MATPCRTVQPRCGRRLLAVAQRNRTQGPGPPSPSPSCARQRRWAWAETEWAPRCDFRHPTVPVGDPGGGGGWVRDA